MNSVHANLSSLTNSTSAFLKTSSLIRYSNSFQKTSSPTPLPLPLQPLDRLLTALRWLWLSLDGKVCPMCASAPFPTAPRVTHVNDVLDYGCSKARRWMRMAKY